jgi:hypothetical protein
MKMPGTAILNGFGRTLGDSIIGLQALAAARAAGAVAGEVTLFRLPGLGPVMEDVYRVAADLATVAALPWEEATPGQRFAPAAGFERVIDIRDFAFDPAFRGTAMIDYFLRALGAEPAEVPPAERRNAWLAPRLGLGPVRRDYVLLCPHTASALRSMPDEVHEHMRGRLAALGAWEVRSQADLPRAPGLGELATLVAGARLVVSADTAMVHLADALDVPCVAFFTTHRPEWRVRDYPRCRAVHLPAVGLEAAQEFVRDEADVAACRASWFAPGADLGWLDPILTDALAEAV